jgi:Protein of unknown function (DUF1579)
MKTISAMTTIATTAAAAFFLAPAHAAEPTPSAATAATSAGQPNEAEMMKQMIELSKLNENHKLLAQLAGSWSTAVTMWMASGAPPMESKGTAVRKPIMGGRYFLADFTGEMKMPGADGKMKNTEFKGKSVEGYDNVKQKFVSTWIDNMGTGILMSEGTYDAGTKTFTYTADEEMIPGTKTKVREVIKLVDKDHHTFEFYEDRGGQDVKTMEIKYTRSK